MIALPLNQILQGDCLELMKQLPDKSVDLILTDPPYNIGKAEWDNIPDYVSWCVKWIVEAERVLRDNGTFWFFHMNFPILADLHRQITEKTSLRHKQLIIIDKGIQSIAGRSGDSLRSYPRATEYLQFYTYDDPTGAEQLSEMYARVNPMAKYLKEEFDRAGVTNKKIAELFPSKTGGLTGCVSNWLMGLNFPTREQYEKMRQYLKYEYLRKEYEELRKEYEELRKEYEELRYTFNLQSGLTDVWFIDFYKEKRIDHETPKPQKLMERIIETATNEGDIVLDCFTGSGSTLVAAQKLNRRWIGIEINPEYIKIAKERVAKVQNQDRLTSFIE